MRTIYCVFETMKQDIITQYQKSLLMLKDAIEACPAALWDDDRYTNRYWRIVYHALFFTDLYLSADQHSLRPGLNICRAIIF